MKRWRATLAFGTLVGASVFTALWWFAAPMNINAASYKDIQVGMSRLQVEEILGGPAGDYNTREVTPLFIT